MKKFFSKTLTALLSVIILLSATLLSGCMGWLDVSVNNISFVSGDMPLSRLELTLGESTELNRYVRITPAAASNKAFTAESSDTSVVEIETVQQAGNVARVFMNAVGVGSATVTATTVQNEKTATLTVNVDYAPPSDITVNAAPTENVCADTVIVKSDDIHSVEFTAEIGDNSDPETVVTWSVSGQKEVKIKATETFSYLPEGVGRTAVTAAVSNSDGIKYSDTLYVNVTDAPESVNVTYTADNLEQEAGKYKTVSFGLDCVMPENNPDPIVAWYVNGEIAAIGNSYGFLPSSPGKYDISVKVNGEPAEIGGKTSVSVFARGTIIPQNVWLDYDNCYPKVYVRWDPIPAAAGYLINLINVNTGRAVSSDLSTDNTALKDKFTDSGCDVTDYLTGSNSIFSTRLSVKVKTLADSQGILSESDWSDTYTGSVVPSDAKSYLGKKFYDGARNYYVKSYDEFYEWFEYAMLWRPQGLYDGEELYLDYKFGSASDVIEQAMTSMHFTGSYDYSGVSEKKNVCKFRIRFYTDASPSLKTSNHTGQAWNAMRPHVNYDENKVRQSRYVFPIDYKTPVTVTTSDQLYYVAQLGYRPVPASGSTAEKLYNYARRTLRYIISDDMTDVEKLHAIYDWIMWRVIYDREVLGYTAIATAVKYESYYLESVFTDTGYYGVCDAMSKAYVLMSCIEGFDCVRVTGYAGSGRDRGGHAWNKVKLGGEWYIVDCTWGDSGVALTAGGASRESANHKYFLVTDADVADTHTEDNDSFPCTAAERYPWYDDDFSYNSTTLDLYLDGKLSGETAFKNELKTVLNYIVSSAKAADKVYSVGADHAANTVTTQYYCGEFVSATRWGSPSASNWSTSALARNMASIMREFGYTINSNYYVICENMGKETHVMLFVQL